MKRPGHFTAVTYRTSGRRTNLRWLEQPTASGRSLNDLAEELDSLWRFILRVSEPVRQQLGAFRAPVTLRDDSENFRFRLFCRNPLNESTSAPNPTIDYQRIQVEIKTSDHRLCLPNSAGREGRDVAATQFFGESKHKTQISVQYESSGRTHLISL